ncbi:HAMP domain-containing protein, partial [Nisaea sp.]|uniref:HAMP domain-containing protein n=1 Tax=Nisaea sp. TaxID=2024842 RepID=UPI003262EC73
MSSTEQTYQHADTAEISAQTSNRSGIGVGGKLYLSIGSMFVITVAAALVAIWAFGELKRAMDGFAGEAIPAIKTSLYMSAESAAIAAKAPEIVNAQTQEERAATESEIEALIAKLKEEVRSLGALDETAKKQKLDLIASFHGGIIALGDKMQEKEAIEARITEKVTGMLQAHQEFLKVLSPLVDDANFNLVITSEDTVDSSSKLIKSLLEGEVNALQAGLRVGTNVRELLALMARTSANTDLEGISPLAERFEAIVATVREYETLLPETEAAQALKDYTEMLITLGEGDDSAFAIRFKELDYNQSLTFQETLDLKAKREALDAKLAELEELFKVKVEPVIDDATFNLAIGGDDLNANISKTINGLVNGDVARLQSMLQLAAEANLLAGLLNSGASAPDISALNVLSGRFSAAKGAVEAAIAVFKEKVDNDAIPELTAQIVSYGTGDNSVFALRQSQLEIDTASLTALDESRAASETIQREVASLVSEAETAAATSESAALSTLEESQNLLFVMVGISAVAGILIGWLLVSRQVVSRIAGLATTMGVIADGNLETDVDTSGSDEITTMARTVEIFRDNGREVERLREEQQRAEARSAEERRQAMLNLADTFEQSVKAIVDQVGLSAQNMEK